MSEYQARPQPVASIINPSKTIYNNTEKDKHQLAIVGNLPPESTNYEHKLIEKELKQKNFADELKRQIEERDYLRKKEEWKKTKGQQDGINIQEEQKKTFYPNDKTFYVQNVPNETSYNRNFDASITK